MSVTARLIPAMLFVTVTAAAPLLAAPAEPTGEFWEVTSKMEMPGMPFAMPANTAKVCMLKGQQSTPGKTADKNKDCTITDLKQSGNTTTFKMKCTGKEPMAGSGEITHTPNSFSQKIKMQSDDGDMLMISNGKRIGGTCKGDEKINEMLGSQAKEVARSCQQALDEKDYGHFLKSTGQTTSTLKDNCKQMPTAESKKSCEAANDLGCTKLRPAMCESLAVDLKTQKSYKKVAGNKAGLQLATECGLAPDKARQQYCNSSIDKKDWSFVGEFCLKEEKVVALRKEHCVGRDYTSVDRKHIDMCSAIGGMKRSAREDEESTPDEGATPNTPETMKKEGLKALKGFLKF